MSSASFQKRGSGYVVRWRTRDGKQHSKQHRRKIDAEQHVARLDLELHDGTYVDPRSGSVQVASYAASWAENRPWRQQTRDRMQHVIKTQIEPRFGGRAMSSIQRTDLQGWVASMSKSGLKPRTVESYYRVFAAILIDAAENDVIRKAPVLRRGDLPRPESSSAVREDQVLTVEQVHAIADAVPERYRALVLVSAGLGLRQGEACGLTVDRVDFLRRHVIIDRQLVTPPGRGPVEFGPPKTESSTRVIPLAESVGELLAAHIEQFAPGDDRGRLIFTSSTGSALRRSTWQAAFSSGAKAAGIDASSHDLRHHCASLLISAGCSVKAVQSFLGHKNASETLDTYGHLWPGDDDKMRAAIDAGFRSTARVVRASEVSSDG